MGLFGNPQLSQCDCGDLDFSLKYKILMISSTQEEEEEEEEEEEKETADRRVHT